MNRKKASRKKPASVDRASGEIDVLMSDIVNRALNVGSRHSKTTKAVDQSFSLKLTAKQREALLLCARIKNKIKEQLKAAGEGTQIFRLTTKELDHLSEEIELSAAFAVGVDKRSLLAVLHRISELLLADLDGLSSDLRFKASKSAPKQNGVIYQFKIKLLHIKPAIWRRIQIRDCTLADLHEYIQAAFGWWNYHLHEFKIDGISYASPMPDGDDFGMEFEDETDVLISELIANTGPRSRWEYIYDFGDGWEHQIQLDYYFLAEPRAKYPLCVEGERACPPEDCGGPWGYLEYLAAIRDPKHENHRDQLDWRGPFNPELFDVKKATKEMRKVK